VSTETVAPADADSTPVFAAPSADPSARRQQVVEAEQALADLELAVKRLWQRFFAPTAEPRQYVPRGSRRSAWTPTNWP
jgi:hypothetical protein